MYATIRLHLYDDMSLTGKVLYKSIRSYIASGNKKCGNSNCEKNLYRC